MLHKPLKNRVRMPSLSFLPIPEQIGGERRRIKSGLARGGGTFQVEAQRGGVFIKNKSTARMHICMCFDAHDLNWPQEFSSKSRI